MRDYETQRAVEGDLTEQDMPAELLDDVEANQTEDDRSVIAVLLWVSSCICLSVCTLVRHLSVCLYISRRSVCLSVY